MYSIVDNKRKKFLFFLIIKNQNFVDRKINSLINFDYDYDKIYE